MKTCCCIFKLVTAVFLISLPMIASGQSSDSRKNDINISSADVKNQTKICVYGLSLKKTLIDSAFVMTKHKKYLNTPEGQDLLQLVYNCNELMYLFDCLDDEASLKAFASLSSYYLGEHVGEIYDCIALRKGKDLLPFLEAMLRNKENECIRINGPKCTVCQDREWYFNYLKALIERIKKGETCPDLEY